MATARIASAAMPSGRDRGACPSASWRKKTWAIRKSAGPPKVRSVKPSVGVVAGMGDRQLVADRDRDQREHHQRQRPGAPPPDGAGVVGGLGHLDADLLGALEVAPPERDGPGEADRQREQALELERLVGERAAHREHGLAQGDDEEQPEALDEVPAGDLGVLEVDAPAAAGEPVQRPHAGVGGDHGDPPEHEAGVAVGDRAGDPERAGDQLPDQVVDEVLTERPAAQGQIRNVERPSCRSRYPQTNSHARSSNASAIETDMSRLANISPTSSRRTGSRSGSSQFAPHAVMYQA